MIERDGRITVYLYHAELGTEERTVSIGEKMVVAIDCYEECDLNHFVLTPIPKGTIVTVGNVITNHFGTFIITTTMQFIKPSSLTHDRIATP